MRRTYTRVVLLVAAFLMFPRAAPALTEYESKDGSFSVRVSGYVKTLALGLVNTVRSGTKPAPDGGVPLPEYTNQAEDFTRARLMLDGDIGARVSWTVHYEHYAVINPVNQATSGFFAGSQATKQRQSLLLPLDWKVKETGGLLWRNGLDRLYVRFHLDAADVTVGRQAISWGVGRIWTPSDLFVAFSPVEIDKEYKTGIDAVSVKVPLGSSAQIETVYAALGEDFRRHLAAMRGQVTLGNFDVGMMGGKFFQDFVTGPFFDGEINGAGVRGEMTFTHNTNDKSPERRTFIRGVVGTDYQFDNNIYALLEYYYNGFGVEDPEDYLRRFNSERIARGELFNVGQHYLGANVAYEPHSLVKTSVSGLWNLLDQSALIGPLCVVSLSDEADLRVGTYFPIGTAFVGRKVKSEFGAYPQIYYLQLRMYF